MGQALYRNYRPRVLSEVIGQEPIIKTLKKAIKSHRISHAYLLCGPHGVGKTSVARIIAHEVNNLPYKGESFHLDIIEVDAASNRKIDEIRDIREKVHIAPTSGKYKVYIIDEVHMLTKEAFNALLKTLEEPPAHCIFILATTEAHKLPATIISRTQRFNFKLVDKDKIVSHLSSIAKSEKIDIEPEALKLLADHGEGSLRDSIGFLDQLSSQSGIITVPMAKDLLGLAPAAGIIKLVREINDGNTQDALSTLNGLRASGASASQIASVMSKQLRATVAAANQSKDSLTITFLKNLLNVDAASQPFEFLEILILETALNAPRTSSTQASPTDEILPPVAEISTKDTQATGESLLKKVPGKSPRTSIFSLDLWPDVLGEIKQRAASVYTALRLAEPQLNGDTLLLQFQFPLHRDKLGQSHNKNLIGDVIEELSGTMIQIKSVLVPKIVKKTPKAVNQPVKNQARNPDELTTISNIFGSAEMLKS